MLLSFLCDLYWILVHLWLEVEVSLSVLDRVFDGTRNNLLVLFAFESKLDELFALLIGNHLAFGRFEDLEWMLRINIFVLGYFGDGWFRSHPGLWQKVVLQKRVIGLKFTQPCDRIFHPCFSAQVFPCFRFIVHFKYV